MNTNTLHHRNVPRFYKKLDKTAVQAYLRRKSNGRSTRHFSVTCYNVKYVFWTTGYGKDGSQFPIRPLVERHLNKMKLMRDIHKVTDATVQSRLVYYSFNKPGVDA